MPKSKLLCILLLCDPCSSNCFSNYDLALIPTKDIVGILFNHRKSIFPKYLIVYGSEEKAHRTTRR